MSKKTKWRSVENGRLKLEHENALAVSGQHRRSRKVPKNVPMDDLLVAIRTNLVSFGGNQYFGLRYVWVDLEGTEMTISYCQARSDDDGNSVECSRVLHLPLERLWPTVDCIESSGFIFIKLRVDGSAAAILKRVCAADGTFYDERIRETMIDMSDSPRAAINLIATGLEGLIKHSRGRGETLIDSRSTQAADLFSEGLA